MSRRFLPALAVAAAVIAFGASPALAATQACHPTPPPCAAAVCVYVDQVPTSGACPKKTVHHSTGPSSSVQPSSGPSVSPTKKTTTNGKNSGTNQSATGDVIKASAPTSPPPSAVSAAFDLGFGPTALFAALLAVAALLALGGGLQNRRRR